jgi:hypothetical protein
LAPLYGSISELKEQNIRSTADFEKIREAQAQYAYDAKQLQDLKDDVRLQDQTKLPKEVFAQSERRSDERFALEHEYAVRDLTRLEKQLDAVDGNLIKRPEVEALLDSIRTRVKALSRSLQDQRRDLGGQTLADQIKYLQQRMEALQGDLTAAKGKP